MAAIKNFYSEEIGDEFDEILDDIDIDEMLEDEFESFHDEDEIDLFEAEFPSWFRDSYNYNK